MWRPALKYVRIFTHWLARIGLVAFFIIFGLLFYLQTLPGAQNLGDFIALQLSGPNTKVKIALTRGSPPRSLHFEGITVADRKGVWLKIGEVNVLLDLKAILDRSVLVEAVQVRRVEMFRRPVPPLEPDTKPFRVPDLGIAVQLKALVVDGFRLDAAVAGVPADLQVRGNGQWTKRNIDLNLDVARIDQTTDRISAKFRLGENKAKKLQLTAALSVRGDADGVLAGLAHLKRGKGLKASLVGDGSLDGWTGDINVNAEGLADVAGKLRMRDQKTFTLVNLDAKVDVKPLMPKDIAARFGSIVDIEAEAKLAKGKPLVYAIKAQNAALEARARSRPDPVGKMRALDVEAKILDASYFRKWLAPNSLKSGSLKGVIEGNLIKPHMKLDVRLTGLSTPYAAVNEAILHSDVRLFKDTAGWGGVGSVKGQLVRLSYPATSGATDNLASLKADFSVDAKMDAVKRLLTISRFDIKDPSLTATGSGNVSFAGAGANFKVQIDAADLSRFEKIAKMPLRGGVTLNATVTQTGKTQPLTFSAQALTRNLDTGNQTVTTLLGKAITVNLDGARDPQSGGINSIMRIKGLTLSGELAGRLTKDQALDATYRVGVSDVSALEDLAGMPLPPSLAISGAARGQLHDLSVDGALTAGDLIRRRLKLTNIKGQFALAHLGRTPAGNASFNMTLPTGKLHASARLKTRTGGVTSLEDILLTAPDTQVSGAVTLTPGRPAVGQLKGMSRDLKTLARQFNIDAGGSASFMVSLKNQEGRQRIEVAANGDKITTILPNREVAKMEKLALAASFVRNRGFRDINIRLNVTDMRAATATINTIAFKVTGKDSDARYDLSAKGDFRGKVSVNASGGYADREDGFDLAVENIDGQLYGRPLKLNKPLRVAKGVNRLTAAPLDISMGAGHLTGEWRQSGDGFTFDATAEKIDLILLSLLYPEAPVNGEGDAQAAIRVAHGIPQGSASVTLRNVTPALSVTEATIPANASLTAKIGARELSFSGRVTAADRLDATLKGVVPLEVNAERQTVSLAKTAPISADLVWRGEIGPVWSMTPASDHRVGGDLKTALHIGGSLVDPQFFGEATLAQGAYDNRSLGLVAREIVAAMAIEGRRLTIKTATANDANGGAFVAKGWVDLKPAERYPALLELKLDKARVMRTSDIKVAASAALGYARAPTEAALSGTANVQQIDGKLISRLPPDVTSIEVTEINLPPSETRGLTTRVLGVRAKSQYPTRLDVKLRAPRRVFIRGRGLDSEWSGDLDVAGTVKKPLISGEMNLVRGTFTMAGKDFVLKEGTLTFIAADKVDPVLNLRAEYAGRDLTAVLLLDGPASRPTIKLTSTPELPQDEVLARILFGTSVEQLGALEAVQLATAVASLSGSGRGLDVMDMARSRLGLDRLRFQSGSSTGIGSTITGIGGIGQTSGAPSSTNLDRTKGSLVAGGKYLTNNIYLEVETATATGQSRAKVKIDISEHFSVESDVGSDNSSGVGIKWEKDY